MMLDTKISLLPTSTYHTLEMLLQVNPLITHLDVSNCKKISDLAVPLILDLPNLQEVHVYGSSITRFGIDKLLARKNLNVYIWSEQLRERPKSH